MSLNWSVAKVKDWETITKSPWDKEKINPVTEALIWKTMAVDLGEISERNVDEFWFRVRLLQMLDGPELQYEDGGVYLTKEDIVAHIGLVSNVIDLPRTKWLNKVLSGYRFKEPHPQQKSALAMAKELAEAQRQKASTAGQAG